MRLTRKKALGPVTAKTKATTTPAAAANLSLNKTDTDQHRHMLAGALDVIEMSMLGIDAIESALGEARELIAEARRSEDAGKRHLLAQRLIFLRNQIDRLASSARAQSVNLIDQGRDTLDINLDAAGAERLAIAHFNLSAGPNGLKLSQVDTGLVEEAEIERVHGEVETARRRLSAVADVFRHCAGQIADHIAAQKDQSSLTVKPAPAKSPRPKSAAAKSPPVKTPGLRRRTAVVSSL